MLISKNKLILLGITVTFLMIGSIFITQNFHNQTNTDFNTPFSPILSSTNYTENGDAVLASDYNYDINTGDLISTKDNQIIYNFTAGKNTDKFTGRPAVYIFSFLDGSKLILWQTSDDNSPLGPNWENNLWLGDELKYLDLNNPSQGLKPYIVPEAKKQAVRTLLGQN